MALRARRRSPSFPALGALNWGVCCLRLRLEGLRTARAQCHCLACALTIVGAVREWLAEALDAS
jgi:hypothetical protein